MWVLFGAIVITKWALSLMWNAGKELIDFKENYISHNKFLNYSYLCAVFRMAKIKKTVSLLLVALFTSYYVGTHFFTHSHQYTWGTITHSHPYSSNTHTHSTNALYLIDSLTTLLFIGVEAVFYLVLLSVLKTLHYCVETQRATSTRIYSNQLRAPPVCA